MRVRYLAALLVSLAACGPAFAQHSVKPDPAAVSKTKKALARAADLDPAAEGRPALIAEVREAPKIVRFEALAQSMEHSAKKVRALAAREITEQGEHAGL